jgi:hypothetical protein
LVDAGVAGVELQKDVVAAHIARNPAPKVGLDTFSQLVEFGHGRINRILKVGWG